MITTEEKTANAFFENAWNAQRQTNNLTLKKTLSLIWSDARQKRVQMVRPFRLHNVFLGIFAVNGIALALWRISMWLQHKRWGGWHLISKGIYFLNVMLFSFDASPFSTVGPGFFVAHLVGCTIHGKIGRNCTLFGRNLVGGPGHRSASGYLGGPVLEDGVAMGFGSSVIGPVTIGKGATVGAGAWCFDDVPAGTIAIGMPAKVHRAKTEEELRTEENIREGRQPF